MNNSEYLVIKKDTAKDIISILENAMLKASYRRDFESYHELSNYSAFVENTIEEAEQFKIETTGTVTELRTVADSLETANDELSDTDPYDLEETETAIRSAISVLNVVIPLIRRIADCEECSLYE